MSYSNPDRRTYTFVDDGTGNFDFGASTETFSVQGPKGKSGRLIDYGVYGVVEAFAGTSSTPIMSVGTPSNADAYGEEFDLGALADNSGKSVRSTYHEYESGWSTYMVDQEIPADQEIMVTCTAAAGSPTGKAIPFVVIDWSN